MARVEKEFRFRAKMIGSYPKWSPWYKIPIEQVILGVVFDKHGAVWATPSEHEIEFRESIKEDDLPLDPTSPALGGATVQKMAFDAYIAVGFEEDQALRIIAYQNAALLKMLADEGDD